VVLEEVEEKTAGEIHFHITISDGFVLFDDALLGVMPPESLKVLHKAVTLQRSRSKANVRSTFTLSKSLGFDHDAQTLGFEHDACLTTLYLCVRVQIPNSRLSHGVQALPRKSEIWDLFTEFSSGNGKPWSPRDFYDNVHVPEKDNQSSIPTVEELRCTLYPFQKRAVHWLLQREKLSGLCPDEIETEELSAGFVSSRDADGRPCFVNSFLGVATLDARQNGSTYQRTRGGLLAEEMGLGKTVEIMALICLHRQSEDIGQADPSYGQLPRTPATLIITPPSIIQQWKNEFQALAPSLRVLIYDGLRVEAAKSDHDELISRFTRQDVVLTTYNVLAKEIHYAESHDRSLRHEKKYMKRLSPLTRMLWWRVVLDEAQMVESGVSNAAKVANLIPRQLAWCVSGTPVRKDAKDLFGLLVFLRYQPYCYMPQLWDRLISHHRNLFKHVFRTITLRHTKEQITDEIQLPLQKRVVITVPFSAIEEQHYSSMFQQMAEACGLDGTGAPLSDDWDPENPETIEQMRTWLTRLRQTCLHPEVGSRNRRALGNGRGPLRTVSEVLEVMIDQNDTATRIEERNLLLSQIRRGQILEHAEYSELALQIWLATLEEVRLIVRDCRHQLTIELDKLSAEDLVSMPEDDKEAAEIARTGPHRQRLRAALEIDHMCIFFAANAYYQIKTKQIAKDESQSPQQSENLDGGPATAATSDVGPTQEPKQMQDSPAGPPNPASTSSPPNKGESKRKRNPNRVEPGSGEIEPSERLEATLEGSHGLTPREDAKSTQEPSSKPLSERAKKLEQQEETFYDMAKLLRRELLLEARKKADAFMVKVNVKIQQQLLVSIPKIITIKDHGGIESRNTFERIDRLLAVMERQTTQITEWRTKAVQLLTLPLVDNEETELVHGDEYESSTKQQDECYVYVDALRAIVSDRHDILTGQDNNLIEHEMKIVLAEAREGRGHAPQLLQQLLHTRRKLKPGKELGSMRGMITELRELKTTLRGSVEKSSSRAAAEHVIVNTALQRLHQVANEQNTAQSRLDKEIEIFKDTMNLRLEYYRQLQAISDTVAPYEENMTDEVRTRVLQNKEELENTSKARIATLKSKGRYLVHLRDETGDTETEQTCIICTSDFENGLLTSCGHSYCADCFRLWWASHRTCPTCKKHLSRNGFHQITYKPKGLTMEEEEAHSTDKQVALTDDPKGSTIYSGIREPILNQIKNIDLDGSFGTKIDTLARHMLWIREHDPGAKSIVFSQYRDFLDVLARAFAQFKIGFTGIDRKDGIQKFKNDPSMECFFLHAKAHSSGLNLVNATHVFLCEPLINTAIELQAIARVHRIGQHHETTVWMYLVEGTVEKSIYDISVKRRIDHMGRVKSRSPPGKKGKGKQEPLESQIEAANTLELEQTPLSHLLTKGSGGGELVRKEDLWNCLFRSRPGGIRASAEAEREVARHVGAEAAEARNGRVKEV